MESYSNLVEKWSPVLNEETAGSIKDNHRKQVTAALLENTERALTEERAQLNEAAPTNATGASINNWDPVLISLVRRAAPNLIAHDLASVQPMNGPTGLIFAMKSKYSSQGGTEALYNEADTTFSGTQAVPAGGAAQSTDGSGLDGLDSGGDRTGPTVGEAMATDSAEALGSTGSTDFAEMAFSIERQTVTAKSRALKAEYSLELAQDLKAIHGLDAESELANILSTEILAEINREIIRVINAHAKPGAQTAQIAKKGIINLDSDVDGRWSAEKFKGLGIQIDREANQIAKDTRRGKGNVMVCSSDVASALAATGMLDYSQVLASNTLNVDDTGNTFAGTLNGRMKVYIDPYATVDYITVGYKGANAYDAGLFYCPYVPLTMMRAVAEDTFQPKIGFKTRYGLASNPFTPGSSNGLGTVRQNQYYRIMRVDNILNT
jgi:hypothetical protein